MNIRRLLLIASIGLLVSCGGDSQPERLSLPPVRSAADNRVEDYVNAYLYSPEMFRHQRQLIDREMELRTNFALRKAMEQGNIRVRAVAPPLQLTGDEAIDHSRTYSVMLIADDIPPGSTFLDQYDVIVAPNSLAAEIQPAMSASSLRDYDIAYAEQRISQLQIDRYHLKSESARLGSIKQNLSGEISDAINLIETDIQSAEQRKRELRSEIEAVQDRIAAQDTRYEELLIKQQEAERKAKQAAEQPTPDRSNDTSSPADQQSPADGPPEQATEERSAERVGESPEAADENETPDEGKALSRGWNSHGRINVARWKKGEEQDVEDLKKVLGKKLDSLWRQLEGVPDALKPIIERWSDRSQQQKGS